MSDLVEAFFDSVRSVEPLPAGRDRRLAIRRKITEGENTLRKSRDAARAVPKFLQQAQTRARAEIARHRRNNLSTRTAEFFQEVFEELSLRVRLTIREMKDDTFRVEVKGAAAEDAPLHIVKSEFYSLKAAQEWVDSDQGVTLINAVIEKYEKSK